MLSTIWSHIVLVLLEWKRSVRACTNIFLDTNSGVNFVWIWNEINCFTFGVDVWVQLCFYVNERTDVRASESRGTRPQRAQREFPLESTKLGCLWTHTKKKFGLKIVRRSDCPLSKSTIKADEKGSICSYDVNQTSPITVCCVEYNPHVRESVSDPLDCQRACRLPEFTFFWKKDHLLTVIQVRSRWHIQLTLCSTLICRTSDLTRARRRAIVTLTGTADADARSRWLIECQRGYISQDMTLVGESSSIWR